MKTAIANAHTNSIIFETEIDEGSLDDDGIYRLTVNKAVEAKANLHGASLNYADLSGMDLSGFDLGGAHLRHANLSGANLTGVSLVGAILTDADLSGANLTGADLRYADVMGTVFTDSVQTGMFTEGANYGHSDGYHSGIPAGPVIFNNDDSEYYRKVRANFPPVEHQEEQDGAEVTS